MVSVVRKVIKEEQNDSSMGSRLTTKKVSRDIVKAADDFASKVGSGKGIDKDKIHRGKGKGNSLKKRNIADQKKSKGNPKGNTKGKSGRSTQSNKTDGKRSKKRGNPPGRTGGKNTRKRWKEKHKKHGSKGKNNDGKSGGKAKKGQK